MKPLLRDEVFGLVHPAVDAHTLGIDVVAALLRESGYEVQVADHGFAVVLNDLDNPAHGREVTKWCVRNRVTRLGISCRLEPELALELVRHLRFVLKSRGLYGRDPSQVRGLAFAGTPDACEDVRAVFGSEIPVFSGDETPASTLAALGVPQEHIPASVTRRSRYDEARLTFGAELIASGVHERVMPPDRAGYPEFGALRDGLVLRVDHGQQRRLPPLIRTHYGPFQSDRKAAFAEFLAGVKTMASSGHVDVLSIGTSQLTQESFGQDWADRPNGGGVPINSAEEYRVTREAALPMLVRTYAGTRQVDLQARVHEESLNIAWHALSFWWFSRIDGRGPNDVRQNLVEHGKALDFIASSGKPFEPNIPHHFSFRGGDDVTYVLSCVLAIRTGLLRGVRTFVVQTMLNTPKATSGVADLAKARAILRLLRPSIMRFGARMILQPRAGLDYLAQDETLARAQLAAVTALMDDIDPTNSLSPEVIHVVGYSEGRYLASPAVIQESVQITQCALARYRQMRQRGELTDVARDAEVDRRTFELVDSVRVLLTAIEDVIPNPYSPDGLYLLLRSGFLAAPYLWECQEEFAAAVHWKTRMMDGSVAVVDDTGNEIRTDERVASCVETARGLLGTASGSSR